MQVFACQYDILWENREGNFEKIRQLLDSQSVEPGSLIVLPEMFSSGFSMNVVRVAEAEPSQAEAFMSEIAEKYRSCVIGGLAFEKEDGRGSNELAVFGPEGKLVGRYQKNHCFTFTGETDSYDPGSGILVFDYGGFKIFPAICYDLRFPELFRRAVQQGADFIVVIASWPVDRIEHWVTLLRARAMENIAPVVGVNRIGDDPKFKHVGRTIFVDHMGKIVADAGDSETCLSGSFDPAVSTSWRKEFPALHDMRL